MTSNLFLENIDFEDEFFMADSGEGYWPSVRRVRAVARPRRRRAGPTFAVVGPNLGEAATRRAATTMPGVFVRGGAPQVRVVARKVGGSLVGPERHGPGLPHYHLVSRRGDRIHIWFGRNFPPGEFFE
jgi:hypothetical protein